jgi:phosphate transport system protein
MDRLNIDQHISHQFNEDLEHLRTKLLEMGGIVEEQLKDAIRAVEDADGGLAEKVIVREQQVDEREVLLDQESISVLARRQPAASDLRLVMMVTKATRDLERIGDESHKIAKMALELTEHGSDSARGYHELRHLARNVIVSVGKALDSFARYDTDLAMEVVRGDKAIDIEYKSAVREMMSFMAENPAQISRIMNILWALRALERIGDHARNVAEQVIYLVHGKDVRHVAVNEIEDTLRS